MSVNASISHDDQCPDEPWIIRSQVMINVMMNHGSSEVVMVMLIDALTEIVMNVVDVH